VTWCTQQVKPAMAEKSALHHRSLVAVKHPVLRSKDYRQFFSSLSNRNSMK
jgi:hypothetical protein